jgi:hypothetical protein
MNFKIINYETDVLKLPLYYGIFRTCHQQSAVFETFTYLKNRV